MLDIIIDMRFEKYHFKESLGSVLDVKLIPMESTQAQVDALICLLKTKNHWVGPMTDALIRNGQAPVAKMLLQMQQTSTA
ncbi:unnamed protein product [Strongylus vulgaris]|uniref:CARD domain-containing protein n=1 Tax=Strongylus vulgaris TaxID=40348 RepID=A0A3P7IWT7_STRVU|nr:unnamed protein product [Strongylus vulgaris]